MNVSLDSQARGVFFFLTRVYTQYSDTIFDDVNKVSENMSHISVILAWKVSTIFLYSTANSLFPFKMKSSLHKSLALEIFVKKMEQFERNKFLLSENWLLNEKCSAWSIQWFIAVNLIQFKKYIKGE